jgi:ornithine cyclodeaminase/alanine dehydrogenase
LETPQTPIRYLPRSAVEALMPSLARQFELVEVAYGAMRDGTCETPATPEVAPRPGAFVHALPAYVADGDITSLKWIGGYPSNREHGLPYLSGLIIINDSATGLPVAVMDCAAITAARTAAVSAICVAAFARQGWSTVGIIGYGVQSEAHVAALSELNPSAAFRVFSRRSLDTRDRRLAAVPDPRAATEGADVVITGMPLEIKLEPPIAFDWLTDNALVLPLDDDASLDADVVNGAEEFYVDALDDYRLRQAVGRFPNWREPDAAVSQAVLDPRPTEGVTVCANQGIGVLDAVFAGFVLDSAERDGVGLMLDR